MDLRWTRGAADDLQRIADYLIEHAPARADLVRTLYDAPRSLLTFPNRGRPGKREGTRELVLSPLPYIIVYQVRGDRVIVVRIVHGAQRWPSDENG
jgi:toxin ParE1/3/4